jgi:cbb3-type cytochrome oxidase subunit 1
MYETVLFIHSYWAYLVLLLLIVASVNALVGFTSGKEYGATNFRIALFTLIVTHIHFL